MHYGPWAESPWRWLHIHPADWAAWLTAVGTLASAAILAATAIFALRALKDAQRTRHAQLLIALSQEWASSSIRDSFKLFGKYSDEEVAALIDRLFRKSRGYVATDKELDDYETLSASANFIETIGVLRADGAMTPEVIYKAWGGPIIEAWGAWHLAMPLFRTLSGEGPDLFWHFENLALEMKAIDRRRARERQRTGAMPATASETGSPVGERGDSRRNAQKPGSYVLQSSEVNRFRVFILLAFLSALCALFRKLGRR